MGRNCDDHEAVSALNKRSRVFRPGWRGLSKWVLENRGDVPWPKWCLVPEEAWEDLWKLVKDDWQRDPQTYDFASFKMLGTWRLSKGVYRLSSEFGPELMKSSLRGKIPVDVLRRLPEWCVYVELDGMLESDEFRDVHGAWIRLGRYNSRAERLFVLLDHGGKTTPYQYDLGLGTVGDMVEAAASSVLETLEAIMDGLESGGRPVDRGGENGGGDPHRLR